MTAPSRYFKDNNARDFHPTEFPEIVAELAALKVRLGNFQQSEIGVIIISCAKTHSVRSDYAKSHAVLIKYFPQKGSCAHLENIFSACSGNARFTNSLETYLKNEMSAFHPIQASARDPNNEMKFDMALSL